MKKLIVKLMDALVKTSVMCLCCLATISLTACGDDDEGGNGGGGTGSGNGKPTAGLISTNIPSQKGWSAVNANGVCTYLPDDLVAYPDDEYAAYFAFSVSGDKCHETVFNMVCDNEAMAKYLEQMLKSGEWAEEDDEDYAAHKQTANHSLPKAQAMLHARTLKATVKKMRAADNGLGLACNRSGRVVYFTIDALRGKPMTDVKLATKVWYEDMDANEIPARPIFGTWDEATGRYFSNSIYAIPGTSLEARAKFNAQNIVTDYTETWTFPNTMWATAMNEVIMDMATDWEETLGADVTVTMKDKTVVVVFNNPEVANISKSLLLQAIVLVDITNACPFGAMIF